jgi:hypothetical protein
MRCAWPLRLSRDAPLFELEKILEDQFSPRIALGLD